MLCRHQSECLGKRSCGKGVEENKAQMGIATSGALLFGDESNCEARALRAATEPFRAIKSVFAGEVLSYLLMTAQGQRVQAGAAIPGIDQHLTMVD